MQGMRTATLQFSESSGSLHRPDLFTELPFLWKSPPSPSFTGLPPPFFAENPLFVTAKCFFVSPPKNFLKFRRVTIRGAQPSARLSEEICLSEGSAGVSQRALRGLSEGSAGSLRGPAGVRGIFRGFRGVVTLLGKK